MKPFLIACSFVLLALSAGAQEKLQKGDTGGWWRDAYWVQQLAVMRLPNPDKTTDSVFLRLSDERRIVDLHSDDGRCFEGTITSYITGREHWRRGWRIRKGREKFFFEKTVIDTAKAGAAYRLWSGIAAIPSVRTPPGYLVNDGTSYSIEMATPRVLERRSHLSPAAFFDIVPGARSVQAFLDTFYAQLGLYAAFNSLVDRLKPGQYSSGGTSVYKSVPYTYRQQARFRMTAPDRAYLASIRDSFVAYLTPRLTTALRARGGLDCWEPVWLLLSPKNRLLRVTARREPRDAEDRRELRGCIRKIRQAVREAPVSFVHSRIPYYVRFEWDNDSVVLDRR